MYAADCNVADTQPYNCLEGCVMLPSNYMCSHGVSISTVLKPAWMHSIRTERYHHM